MRDDWLRAEVPALITMILNTEPSAKRLQSLRSVLSDGSAGSAAVDGLLRLAAEQDLVPTSNPGVQRILKLTMAQMLMQAAVPETAFNRKRPMSEPYRHLNERSEVFDVHDPGLASHDNPRIRWLSELPSLLDMDYRDEALMALLQDSFAAAIFAKHKAINIAMPITQVDGFGIAQLHSTLSMLDKELGAMVKAYERLIASKACRRAEHLQLLMRGCGLLIKQYFHLSEKLLVTMMLDEQEGISLDPRAYRVQFAMSDSHRVIAWSDGPIKHESLQRRVKQLHGLAMDIMRLDKADDRAAGLAADEAKRQDKATTERRRRYGMFAADSDLTRSLLAAVKQHDGELTTDGERGLDLSAVELSMPRR